MPEYMISGIPVIFPFEPYDLQKDYMEKVIECLENGTNGVLESPTGTGKTLSLLCSSLAWLTIQKSKHQNDLKQMQDAMQNPTDEILNRINLKRKTFRIIYASRTHSQISQAMQELKSTSYHDIKAAVIGSRDQLCINTDVMNETNNSNKINMCKLKIRTRTCSFYYKVESMKDHPDFRNARVMDIEDLVQSGRKLRCCPYFISKEVVNDADIVFMPYNYLLDPVTRSDSIVTPNSIIILDEAHNVEKTCEESASVQFASSQIAVCIDDITYVMKQMEEGNTYESGESKDFTIDDLALLKELMLKLEKTIDAIEITNPTEGKTFAGSYIFDLFKSADIHNKNQSIIRRLLDSVVQYLTATSAFRRGGGIQKFYDLLGIIFSDTSSEFQSKVGRCYKVHVEFEQTKAVSKSSTGKDGWIQPKANVLRKTSAKVINYWCFNPGFGMQYLFGKQVRSIILTSGTLAPLKPLISELSIPISVRLENPHIIKSSQICVKIVSHGPDKEPLISNFGNRNNPKFIMSLGRTILSFCPVIPHGLLVFFTSYSMLNSCRDSWQASGIWSQIQRSKPIFVEPKTKDAFVHTMNEYYANISNPSVKGAIFMAVCRGKVSEGLDFADVNGRAVIITGLPFPPYLDQRVILKKKYLQENRSVDNEMLSGDEWYFLEATRAVNQAIGRVIRHRNDYGAILLCDSRFNQPRQKAQLSSWIQGHLNQQQQYSNFGPLIGEVSRFFRNAERTLPQPEPKSIKSSIEHLNTYSPIKYTDPSSSGSSSYSSTRLSSTSTFNNVLKSAAAKIENSNSVFDWDPSIYQSASGSKTSQKKPQDFLSRLNEEVKTIDFNNFGTENVSGLVNIHKRDRGAGGGGGGDVGGVDGFQTAQSIAKKRKLKIVPNEHDTGMVGGLSVTPSAAFSEQTMPDDRKDVLKLLKASLSPPKYSLFIKALTAYQKESNFEELITAFIDIFNEPCFHYLFKGMRRFIKDTHKESFDENIKNLT